MHISQVYGHRVHGHRSIRAGSCSRVPPLCAPTEGRVRYSVLLEGRVRDSYYDEAYVLSLYSLSQRY